MIQPDIASAPLTEAQLGLWYAQKVDPQNPIFNTGQYVEMRGALDIEAFHVAVNQTIEESDALALRMNDSAEGPRQWIDPGSRPSLVVIDLVSETRPHDAAMTIIHRDMNHPLDPTRERLASEVLFQLGEYHYIWYQRAHHLAVDGYGTILLTNRVADLYASLVSGSIAKPRLAPLKHVYEQEKSYRDSNAFQEDAAYWAKRFTPVPSVVSLANGRAVTGNSFHRCELTIGSEIVSALVARSRRFKLPWPDVLTAIIAAYCKRHIDADDIVVGVPFMDRFGRPAAGVPATLTNILPLFVTIAEDMPLDDLFTGIAQDLAQARRHGRYRSEQIRRDLGLLGGHKRLYGPLINVLPFRNAPVFHGVETALHVLGTGPVDDLTFTVRGDASEALSLELDVNPALYTAQEAEAHALRLIAFMEGAVEARTLDEIGTASPAEVAEFMSGLEATRYALPDATLASLLDAAMQRDPQREAVAFEAQSLTYAELDQRTRSLAAHLRECGVGPDVIVAVGLPRALELVIALVAIIRAGGAYLPLDLSHPIDRLRRIIASASPLLALVSSQDAALFDDHVPVFAPEQWPLGAANTLDHSIGQDDAVYVIYTSGSTGEPKGVVVEHRAIVNRLLWMRDHYGIRQDSRILQKTPATFDVSVWEFFLPLISGALLVIAPPDAHKDPVALVELIGAHRITTLHFVPSMLAAFLAEPMARGLAIPQVFCSGEELTADLRDRFHRTISGELHNLYGPTEAAVDVSYWAAEREDRSNPLPIGFPVWNTRLYVLDDRLRPQPSGVVGHLFLAGIQLARGYLGRPDLTEDRFIADPFVPGERMYRTGDLALCRADGAFVYLGRSDHQVKIRGLRIELGEIETAILGSELVARACVIARDDFSGERRLVAYVVPNAAYDKDRLRDYVAGKVPSYMVPSSFVVLAELPVTSNGKLDRAALPTPDLEIGAGRAPVTQTEQKLADLFSEVLRLDARVNADSDFFTLGGDSLLAVRLVLSIREQWDFDLGLGTLFEHPTVAALAERIDAGTCAIDHGLSPLISLRKGNAASPPLFLVHPAGGVCWCYRDLARLISPTRTVYGLQAPMLDGDLATPPSLEALAAAYVTTLLETSPRGPYHLAGWSVGGIIAQAMAARLEMLGHGVGFVGLLDAYPSDCWRDEPEPDESASAKALLAIAGYDPDIYPHLTRWDGVVEFLRHGDSILGQMPDQTLDGIMRSISDNNRLVRHHSHSRYGGRITHFRAALDHADSNLYPQQWEAYIGVLDVIDIPSLHAHLTGPDATRIIAPQVSERLTMLDAAWEAQASA